MTVKEYIKKAERSRDVGILSTVVDFLHLLDEFGDQPCSILAIKIRDQMIADNRKQKSKIQ
jgi:hypothetical protein